MHFQRYDQIDWLTECRAEAVRLVLPLLVIDELDAKSYNSSPRGERVKKVLRSLEKARGDASPELPVRVRDRVTYQVLMDPDGHQRRPNNDDEILSRAERLAELVGAKNVLIVTGDRGMKLRASARGLRCEILPDRLRIREADKPDPS
jgi:predicted ribonuclease YlaK